MSQSPTEERMSVIAERFPSLQRAAGVRPWNAQKLAQWAVSGHSHGEVLAARFVLNVWNGAGYWPWDDEKDPPLGTWTDDDGKLRPVLLHAFDLFEAKGTWDEAHQRAFAAWVAEDWRFCP